MVNFSFLIFAQTILTWAGFELLHDRSDVMRKLDLSSLGGDKYSKAVLVAKEARQMELLLSFV